MFQVDNEIASHFNEISPEDSTFLHFEQIGSKHEREIFIWVRFPKGMFRCSVFQTVILSV